MPFFHLVCQLLGEKLAIVIGCSEDTPWISRTRKFSNTMASPRTIRDADTSRKQRNQSFSIISALWHGGWALILFSLTILLFITKTMVERLIFLGLIALGVVMLFYAVTWALILGTSFA
jgi:hypothetical protein